MAEGPLHHPSLPEARHWVKNHKRMQAVWAAAEEDTATHTCNSSGRYHMDLARTRDMCTLCHDAQSKCTQQTLRGNASCMIHGYVTKLLTHSRAKTYTNTTAQPSRCTHCVQHVHASFSLLTRIATPIRHHHNHHNSHQRSWLKIAVAGAMHPPSLQPRAGVEVELSC